MEATALGNIAVQLIREGLVSDHAAITELIQNSEKIITTLPEKSMEAQIQRLKQIQAQMRDYAQA